MTFNEALKGYTYYKYNKHLYIRVLTKSISYAYEKYKSYLNDYEKVKKELNDWCNLPKEPKIENWVQIRKELNNIVAFNKNCMLIAKRDYDLKLQRFLEANVI